MKPKTFFKSALLIPYILWIIGFLIVYLTSLLPDNPDYSNTNSLGNVIIMVVFYYTFGAIVWFIPYTLLAAGLLIWSRRKPITDIYKAALLSPLFFFGLMSVVSVLLFIDAGGAQEIVNNAKGPFLVISVFSLVFGYLCVGIGMGMYKLLKSRGLIKEEMITTPEILISNS